jgi:hypothetical protein
VTARLIRFARLPSLMTGLVLLLALPAAGRSAEPSAKTFLESIYKSYVGSSQNEGVGIVLAKPETVKRYFTAGLASLMLEDNRATARRNEPPTLDGDAFIGRQDWEIAALTVEVADNGPIKATGTVTYTNFGKPEKVVLDLLKVGDDWRIADIKYADGSLRALYIRK